MIVDCHTHINYGEADVEVSEYLAASETVDKTIVLACPDASSEQANRKVAEHLGRYSEKMVGFGVVEPTQDDVSVKAVGLLRDKFGFSGAVLYCAECGFHPAHSRAMRFYASAQEGGFCIFFHNSGSLGRQAVLDYAQPYLLDEIARTFGDLKIIIGDMGAPFVEQALALAAKHENVYADLTINPAKVWQVYNTVVSAYEYGVMDKLVFGSGFPLGRASECIETLLGFNKLLGDTALSAVPRSEIRKVVERDALEVLGIAKGN